MRIIQLTDNQICSLMAAICCLEDRNAEFLACDENDYFLAQNRDVKELKKVFLNA